jgi:lysophospholipase L1-like esterase
MSGLPLRIAGFGACMITGYPHKGGGLFEIACGLIEKGLSRPVESTIVSLGGFPAPRAEKYLKHKIFDFDPSYVVIQFGATDAQSPIRKRSRPTDCCSRPSTDRGLKPSSDLGTASYHSQPATVVSPLRWELASLIGYLRKIDPITPLSLYIAAVGRMVDDCRSAGITPVVLSPFVYGSRYTMRNAISYTNALNELLRAQDVILVDCVRSLAKWPKSLILQHDGFHLSRAGHNVIGEAIAQAIVVDVRALEGRGGGEDPNQTAAVGG